MENKNHSALPENEDWFDSLLKSPELGSEIGPDEQAISGLPELSDMELEKILKESLEEDLQEDPEPEQVPVSDQEYRDDEDYYSDSASTDRDSTPENNLQEQNEDKPEDLSAYSGNSYDSSHPPRKVRPKRKKGYGLLGIPHLLSVAIWVMIVITIGISFGRLLWLCAADVLAFGRSDHVITVSILESDDVDNIATKLQNAGLIKYKELFKLYAQLSNAEEKIKAGQFELNTLYDYSALVKAMSGSSSTLDTINVLIPEGYNCAQIFALLEEKGVCSAAALEEYAANGDLNERWFLEGLERGNKYCLEGYLFPDTYNFYINDTPSRVIGKMLDGFGSRLDETKFRELLAALNQRLSQKMASHGYGHDYISQNLMDIHKVITLASIVEKESANSAESYTIASVFYNRLTYRAAFPYLDSDATVYYAFHAIGTPKEDKLTAEDYKIDSPYNTYVYAGLVPGPISNPSLASIYATLDPDDSNYYYFIYDKHADQHRFSSTLEEHNEWKTILGG